MPDLRRTEPELAVTLIRDAADKAAHRLADADGRIDWQNYANDIMDLVGRTGLPVAHVEKVLAELGSWEVNGAVGER